MGAINGTWMDLNVNDVLTLSILRREPNWMISWRVNAFYCLMLMNIPKWSDTQQFEVELSDYGRADDCEYLQNNKMKNNDTDIVYNSNSIYLNISKELRKLNITFMPLSKAILLSPKLVRRYMGGVVYHNDNYYSALNSSMFTDGTFVRIPRYTKCPINLVTYFKITANCLGQFERTLIIIEPYSKGVYFEGCNSGKLTKAVLHSAVVEIVIHDYSSFKYTTLQNWSSLKSGVYNFVTKRALCMGIRSKMVWTQVELGSVITWKYPSTVLLGVNSNCEFYSLNINNRSQRMDTGTKCLHLANGSNSIVLAKSILMGQSVNMFRVLVLNKAKDCRSYIKCDSLLTGVSCITKTLPIIKLCMHPMKLEYESLNSYITERQFNYCAQRGLNDTDTIKLVVGGYANEIIKKLPFEAAVEVAKLMFL